MFLCPKKLLMGLLFMLLASSVAFQAVRSVLGGWIASAEGLPKIGGLFVHALVFLVLSTMIWRMPFGSSNFEGMDDEEFVRRKMFGRSQSGDFFPKSIGSAKATRALTSEEAAVLSKIFKKKASNYEEEFEGEGEDEYAEHDGEDEYAEHDGEEYRRRCYRRINGRRTQVSC